MSEKLFSRVTKYHAQIGATVKKDTLNQLEWNLLTEAKEQFHRGEYEMALNTFTACLAVTEKTRNSKDFAVRGAIVHNIASCLHHLGEIEAAQEYYEQAINSFEKAKMPVVEKLLYGDTNKRRVDFVKERLIDISWGRKPDIDKYLDENGRKRPVPAPPPELAGEQKLSSKWGEEEAPPPPWAERDMSAVNADYPYDRRPAWMSATRRGGGGARSGGAYASVGNGAPRWPASLSPPSPPPRPALSPSPPRPLPLSALRASPAAASLPPPPLSHRRLTPSPPPLLPPGPPGLEEHSAGYDSADAGAGASAEDDATQEQARREWLQYYLQTSAWEQAEELVVTADEREDLEYLRDRERRLGPTGGGGSSYGREGQLLDGELLE